MRMTTCRSSWIAVLLAGVLSTPVQLAAQGSDTLRTHVVRPGETLWQIANDLLGNGRRWREILQVNAGTIRSAESLVVGSTIRIPATAGTPAPARPTPRAPGPPARPPADSVRVAAPTPTPSPDVVQARDTGRRTVFFGARPGGGFSPLDSARILGSPTVPPARGVFEALSAPFVTEAGSLDRGGRCVALGDSANPDPGGVLLHGTIRFAAPPGVSASPGSRWLLVRRGPVLAGIGSVGIPTGLVRVTGSDGSGASGEVVAQFDAMACSDMVLPAPAPAPWPTGPARPVAGGASGHVTWVASESLLPTVQHALILDLGPAAGVRPGDGVTIYLEDGTTVVAHATIARVDASSSTAIVTRQSLGSLAAGLPVRVSEKLP